MDSGKVSLKRNILWPFILGSGVLFVVFLASVYHEEKGHLETEFRSVKSSVADVYGVFVRDRAEKLAVALNVLRSDPQLAKAMVARDRAQLFELSKPKFESLRGALGVTHLYFHDPARVNLLRVHQPDRYGDLIDRFTAREAEQLNNVSFGVELGPLGTFTLRVVTPWRRGDTLLGYIELGEEVEEIATSTAALFKLDISVLIQKQYLTEADWREGSRMLGHPPNWNTLPQEVVAYQNRLVMSDTMLVGIAERVGYDPNRVEHLTLGGRHFLVGMFPLRDASHETVGRMLVTSDMSERVAQSYNVVLTMTAAALFVGPILIMMFYLVLGRAEKQLEQWRNRVTEEGRDRIRVQQAHIRALEHATLYDGLTGLPNRRLLHEQLNLAIKTNPSMALVLMNLRGISEINDTLSHEIGDSVLQDVAERLRNSLPHAITIARPGGDEFAIVLPDVGRAGIVPALQTIQDVLVSPFHLNEITLDINANLGVALFPEHGQDAMTLLRRADAAMRQSKRNRENVAVYDSRLDINSVRRLSLLSDLRNAIAENGLDLHYQPQVALAGAEVVAAEALARWHHPMFGAVPPGEFIALAEHSGLIKPLTRWVLNRALADQAAWRARGRELCVCVNLSAHDLADVTLPDYVAELLETWKAAPAGLVLELTESAVMHEPDRAMQVLHRFAAMGISLSVDDFGTGYSSLAYLKQMPVAELKVDRSFIADLSRNPNDAKIVASTISLAHTLGLTVVAEGVEDKATWDRLVDLGCDRIQGFFITRPMPAAAVMDWLASARGPGAQKTAS